MTDRRLPDDRDAEPGAGDGGLDLRPLAHASREECAAVLTAVAARLVALSGEAAGLVDDRVLDVAAAAARLGVSVAACYKGAQSRYRALLVDNGTRRVMFSAAKIAAYLRRGDRRDAGSTAPIASGARGASRVRVLPGPSGSSSRTPEGPR